MSFWNDLILIRAVTALLYLQKLMLQGFLDNFFNLDVNDNLESGK